MAAENTMQMPLRGVELNELLNVYTTVNSQVKQAELNHFITSGLNVPIDYMEIGLKGAIMSHFI